MFPPVEGGSWLSRGLLQLFVFHVSLCLISLAKLSVCNHGSWKLGLAEQNGEDISASRMQEPGMDIKQNLLSDDFLWISFPSKQTGVKFIDFWCEVHRFWVQDLCPGFSLAIC